MSATSRRRRRHARRCSRSATSRSTSATSIALKDISVGVDAGEVTCVLGDNGAGKSTFIKILSGVHRHDEGELLVEGEPTHFARPREAQGARHRDRLPGPRDRAADVDLAQLLPRLGADEGRGPAAAHRRRVRARTTMREEMRKMGIDVRDPDQPVGTLSGGERQAVAIARAVYFGAKVLILDEPTVGARRQAVGRRAALRRAGARPRARRDLHHPQPAPRATRSATAS